MLVAAGLLLALFFLALLGIADCLDACRERGERAPAIALAAGGVGLVVLGARLGRGARTAARAAARTTGVLTFAGSALALATGEGGWTWLSLVGGAALAVVGLLRRG